MDNSTTIPNAAPIALFTYNRPSHLKRTVESLKSNYLAPESDLFIFSDGWKDQKDRVKVEEVRLFLKTISGFSSVTIYEKQTNCGLANSLISGISELLARYDRIIVVEDDLVSSPYALTFLNDSLEIYKNDKNVSTIHCHTENIKELPELYFYNKSGCLFWATWARAWTEVSFDGATLLQEIVLKKKTKEFDINGAYPYTQMLREQIEGKNNSWAIRVYASFFLKNMLTLYPGESLVQHIGFDGGTHYKEDNPLSDIDGVVTSKEIAVHRIPIRINKYAVKKIELFYKRLYKSERKISIPRILRKIKKEFNRVFT